MARTFASSQPIPSPLLDRQGQWDITARGGLRLRLSWQALNGGRSAQVTAQEISSANAPQSTVLLLDSADANEVTWLIAGHSESIDVTLSLRQEPDLLQVAVYANVPLKPDEFFNGPIGIWPIAPPAPSPEPSPTPSPPDGVLIEPEANAADLFPLLWLAPLSAGEQANGLLRYMTAPDPGNITLYKTLAGISGPDAVTQKRAAAQAFESTAGSGFVADVGALPAPINQFPAIRSKLAALPGVQSLETVRRQAFELLALPPDGSLDAFLTVNTATWQDLWQTVCALALLTPAGPSSPPVSELAASLVDSLRVFHYLQALDLALHSGLPRIEEDAVRQCLLQASPSLPNTATAYALAGTVAPASADEPNPTASGQWTLLGVGELELARYHLMGYVPGALAEIVNVMPRERQERYARQGQSYELTDDQKTNQAHKVQNEQLSDASNELANSLKEVMASEGLVRNLAGVTPSYSNLNLLLTGTASEGGARMNWDGGQVANLLQRMSERAVRNVSDQLHRERTHVSREWREQRETQCIDNSNGERLVGVYRWVDRLVQVCLRAQGRRLVLSFQIDLPAKAWIEAVAGEGPVALVPPSPLAAFSVANGQGYQEVNAANYQSWGAQYGLNDLPPPPADNITVSAVIHRVSICDSTQLTVPEGYGVVSGTASIALADNRYSIAATVAGVALAAASTPSASPELTLSAPSVTSSTSVGDLTIQPPLQPSSTMTPTTGLMPIGDEILGWQGAVPITVLTTAPLFGVAISLKCARLTVTSSSGATPVDPLLVQWQIKVFKLLLEAWQRQARAYRTALDARILAVSSGRTDQIQRQMLQRQCLSLLTATSATENPQQLVGLLEWTGMSWHYDDAIPGNAPQPVNDPSAVSSTEPGDVRLFRRFLNAQQAFVTLPVRPASQTALLFALQWQPRWPSPTVPRAHWQEDIPVAQANVVALEEQAAITPEPPHAAVRSWTLRLPLPQMYLQVGDTLPRLTVPDCA
jgi:hypothetical protein